MNTVLNRDNLTFSGVQWFLWSALAIAVGFYVPYLKQNGYDEMAIGALMSGLSLAGIVGPVIWGIISDRMKTCRWLLAANLLIGGSSALLVPLVVKDLVLLAATMALGNLTACSMTVVVDGWVMRLKSRGSQINYGVTRGAGSLAFALTNIICGILLTRFGIDLMFPLICGFGFAGAVIVMVVRDTPSVVYPQAASTISKPDGQGNPPAPLHKNAAYLIFVIFATILYMGQTATMSFYPVLLQQTGGNNANLGLALGIAALSEFPLMFLSAMLLKKFKDTTLLLVAFVFYTIRFFLFFSLQTTTGLVWSQLTNSLSFGIFMPTSVHFIIRVTPAKLKATALAVASSSYMGIGGIVGNAAGGFISKSLGLRPMFGMAVVLAAAVTVSFGLILFFTRKKGTFVNAYKLSV